MPELIAARCVCWPPAAAKNRSAIATAGAIAPLVAMLQSTDDLVRAKAANALHNLAARNSARAGGRSCVSISD